MSARARFCRHCASHLPKAAARCVVCGALAKDRRPAAPAALRPQPRSAADPVSAVSAAPPILSRKDLPRISVTTHDHSRLGALARQRLRSGRAVSWFLMAELERAVLCRPEEVPGDVATMDSRVLFQIGAGPEVQSAVLAYPDQYAPSQQRVSVLNPLGTALLGLREGDWMPFEDWRGRKRSVVLKKVAFQPEAQGRDAR